MKNYYCFFVLFVLLFPENNFSFLADQPDIIDEAIDFFKANVMFRNYEVEGPADRVLVYLTLYIHLCLTKIANKSKGDAVNTLYQLAISNFSIPGDSNFSLGGFVSNPANRGEAGKSNNSRLWCVMVN